MFNDTPPQRAFWSNTPPLGAEIIRKQVVEKYFKSWFLRHFCDFWGALSQNHRGRGLSLNIDLSEIFG